MKRCPYCRALNSDRASFCWSCYKRLYPLDVEGYVSLRRRIQERMRDILQYPDIRELLKEKIRLLMEREKEREREKEEMS
jgi:hypothetical protein